MPAKFAIDDDVREVLGRAEMTDRTVRLVGQLERPLYVRVNKVLEGAGGKWSRKDRAHVFERDPRELLGLAVETGEAVDRKALFQAFYTPDALADRVAELADVQRWFFPRSLSVLEPSYGEGALARAVWRRNRHAGITGYDIDPDLFGGSEHGGTVVEGDAGFGRVIVAENLTVWERDFLAVSPTPTFDRVVMNPPFSGGAAAKHVVHAFRFLAPGGRLVAIVPSGLLGSERGEAVREVGRLFRAFGDHSEEAPERAFHDAGTDVRTRIIRMTRPVPAELDPRTCGTASRTRLRRMKTAEERTR